MKKTHHFNHKSEISDSNKGNKETIEIRKVSAIIVFDWLKSGIRDLTASPAQSFSHGLVYVVVGLLLILLSWNKPIYSVGMAALFYMVAPFIAVGLYCMSRHIEEGIKPSWDGEGYRELCSNFKEYLSLGIIIGLLAFFWVVVATVIISINFNNIATADTTTETITHIINQNALLPVSGIVLLAGLGFAVLCFMITVISIPLITDRKVDVITAMVVSAKSVIKNPITMILWATIIVLLIGLGFAFAFVGLAFTLPIIGHASWHVYRELIVDDSELVATEDSNLPTFAVFNKGV